MILSLKSSKYVFFLYFNSLVWLIFLQSNNYCYSQNSETYNNITFKSNIRTVQIYAEGSSLSYPIIQLNSEDNIILSFDELSNEVTNYSYTIIHCSSNWVPTDLVKSEYIEGFTEDYIHDYQFSFNTYMNYIHYSLSIPNENMKPKISGNYIIKVYEDYDENNIILIKRFSIYEPKVNIKGSAKKPLLSKYMDVGQEIDFSIRHSYYKIDNPHNEVKVSIIQNGDWNRSINDLKPLFTRNNELDYNYNEENIFDGNNEFRYFDIKSLRYQSRYVKNIKYDKYFHVLLFPDKSKGNKLFFTEEDINGKYFIHIQESKDDQIEADYVYVYFTLEVEYPFSNGNVYVYGELSNWECNKENKMLYNPDTNQYELTLLLKQGHYNYHYAFVADYSGKINTRITEGNHFETENDYIIYVYHKDYSSRYDKLVGVKYLNSANPDKFK